MNVEIENDIPIPPKGTPIPRTEPGRVAMTMGVGQSVICRTVCEYDTVRTMLKRLGGRYTSRKMDGGWRVWRIG